MSGPKVVRVVTRDEIVALCQAHLRRLERAIAAWESTLRQLGDVDETARVAVGMRYRELEALLASDKFLDLQKGVPAEVAFLEGDEERRRQKVAATRAQAAQRVVQLKRNAAVLLRETKARGAAIDASTTARLEAVATGKVTGEPAEAVLAQAFGSLAARVAPSSLTSDQLELARRLSSGSEGGQDFLKWQAAHSGRIETRTDNLQKRLAELAIYLGDDETRAFAKRLEELHEEHETEGWDLRIDSLVVDVSHAVSKAKQGAELRREAEDVLAELDQLGGTSVNPLKAELSGLLKVSDVARLQALIAEGRSALSLAAARKAADARRAAILEGLKTLGYDVREGMSTAWEQKGRLVVRKPGHHDYGVEISSAANAERLQVRAVAFSASRTLSRDAGVETAWCGDFGKLQSTLASQGGAISIEKANPIGALPLKVVDAKEVAVEQGFDTSADYGARRV